MMLVKLGPLELVKKVKDLLKKNTKVPCYDVPPNNAPSPLIFIELVSIEPVANKLMYRDQFTVYIHAITKASESNVEIYKLIQEVEEAFSVNIDLQSDFKLIKQISDGLITIKKDPSNEKHAVLSYSFDVCYGYKIKEQ